MTLSYVESKKPDEKPRGMTQHRYDNPTLGTFTDDSSSSSSNSTRNLRNAFDLEETQNKALKNAPDKYMQQEYKAPESQNKFYDETQKDGRQYNTYTRKVANPEYNEYIQEQNQKYSNKYGGQWQDLKMNNFDNKPMEQGIWENSQSVNNQFGGTVGGALGEMFGEDFDMGLPDWKSGLDWFDDYEEDNDSLGKTAGRMFGGMRLTSTFSDKKDTIGKMAGGMSGGIGNLKKAFFE